MKEATAILALIGYKDRRHPDEGSDCNTGPDRLQGSAAWDEGREVRKGSNVSIVAPIGLAFSATIPLP